MGWLLKYVKGYLKKWHLKGKTDKKASRQVRKKVLREKLVKTSFAKVKTDVKGLEQKSDELSKRIALLEKKTDVHSNEMEKHSKWLQYHNQQLSTLSNNLSTATFRIERVESVSEEVKELKKQFAELIRQAGKENGELKKVTNEETTALMEKVQEIQAQKAFRSDAKVDILEKLTPYTRRALFLIVSMLHETNLDWLPLAQLTGELYPDREGKKVHNVVANVLRPLYQQELLEKHRRGSNVFVKPTKLGLSICKEHLKDSQLKSTADKIDRVFRGLESKKAKSEKV